LTWERIGTDRGFRSVVGRASLDDGRTVIVKVADGEGAANEARFYERVDGAPAPRAYHVASDGHLVVLVLEEVTGRLGDALLGCSIDEAALVLERMAQFRVSGTGFPRWGDRLAARQQRYDAAVDMFLNRHGDRFPPEIRMLAERLRGRLAQVVEPLAQGPLIHGDLHLDNVIFDGDRAVILDWQTARVAPPVFDFVLFAYSSVSIDDRRALERRFKYDGLELALINAFAGTVIWFARPDIPTMTGRERAFVDLALTDGRLVSGLLDHGTLSLVAV
jgi:aminoglycoside phosphotransferase (APT) family kinase protein